MAAGRPATSLDLEQQPPTDLVLTLGRRGGTVEIDLGGLIHEYRRLA